jgi:hypothetical protein
MDDVVYGSIGAAICDGASVKLYYVEAGIEACLLSHRQEVGSHEEAIDDVWRGKQRFCRTESTGNTASVVVRDGGFIGLT